MQTNQEWQPKGEDAVAPVILPSLPDSLASEIAGSNAYVTKDSEQETLNKTSSNTHVTLAEACAQNNMEDDSYSSKDHVE